MLIFRGVLVIIAQHPRKPANPARIVLGTRKFSDPVKKKRVDSAIAGHVHKWVLHPLRKSHPKHLISKSITSELHLVVIPPRDAVPQSRLFFSASSLFFTVQVSKTSFIFLAGCTLTFLGSNFIFSSAANVFFLPNGISRLKPTWSHLRWKLQNFFYLNDLKIIAIET